jgi:protein phosphatase
LTYTTVTDSGLQRSTNEDRAAGFRAAMLDARSFADILVVADGMGAESGGAKAAQTMVDSFSKALTDTLARTSPNLSRHQLGELMDEAIVEANTAVRAAQRKARVTHRHMATTCACVLIHGQTAVYGNVGDSRIYLLRHGTLNQMSVDHSLIWDIQERASSDSSQFRRSITRGIGFADHVNPDIGLLTLHPGDRLLLCSDGLTNYAYDEDIARTLKAAPTAAEACTALLEAATRGGGGDNITITVCDYGVLTPITDDEESFEADQDDIEAARPIRMRLRLPARKSTRTRMAVFVSLVFVLIGLLAYRRVTGHERSPAATLQRPANAPHGQKRTAIRHKLRRNTLKSRPKSSLRNNVGASAGRVSAATTAPNGATR